MMPASRFLIAILAIAAVRPAEADDHLNTAREQFQRHNYKAALAALDRHTPDAGDAAAEIEAPYLRARCLLKLRRWNEGVTAMEKVLADHPSLRSDPEAHLALADVGSVSHRHKHLSIIHFAAATELFLASGDRESAAEAAIQCGHAYVHFNDWDKLDDPTVDPPTDWRASRALQRSRAVGWLDRGVELTTNDATASAAVYAKAKLFHQSLRTGESDVDTAMETYRELLRRWPRSREAPRAALEIGRLLERHRQDYVGAAQQYRNVIDRYELSQSARQATQSLSAIVTPVIRLGTDGVTPPGRTARIDIETRNVKTVSFHAYRVDLFDLIREIGHVGKLDEWAPDTSAAATWSIEIPDSGEHKHYSSRQDHIPPTALPITEPGAYVVSAESEHGADPASAKALILVSRLAAVTKGHKGGALLWSVDADSGQPIPATRVMVQKRFGRDQYDYREGATDDEGFFQTGTGGNKHGGSAAFYLRDGDHYAICDASFSWYWWGYQNDYRLYTFTDRPVYRPDQVIHFKHVLRRYDAGDYHNVAKTRIDLTVYDPKGQAITERSLTTNEHGSVSGDLILPPDAPLGVYRMRVETAGRAVQAGRGGVFRVEEYRKPEFEVTVASARPRHTLGGPVDVRIEARYYFGSPVPEASIAYTVHRSPITPQYGYPGPYPWYFEQLRGWWSQGKASCLPRYCFMPWREMKSLVERGELTTDAGGVALLRVTPDAADDIDATHKGWRYTVDVEATDASRETVTGSGTINVTRDPFTIELTPQRRLYQPGDTVQIDIKSTGPNDAPVAFDGHMRVHRLIRREIERGDGRRDELLELGERIHEAAVSVDATGLSRFRLPADEEGPFRCVLATASHDGIDVSGSCDVWITRLGGRFDHYAYRDIELIPDKFVYEVGDTARFLINTKFDDARVLLTIEADDLLDRRLLRVDGSAVVELPIETAHTPNFYVAVTLVRDQTVHQDMQAIVVPPTDRFLTVAIADPPTSRGLQSARTSARDESRGSYLPREQARFAVTTTDAAGAPVDAEVALMMVDASLYHIQSEFRERIEKFFYGATRPHLVSTRSSFDRAGGHTILRRGGVAGDRVAKTMAPQAMAEGAATAMTADGGGGGDDQAFAVAEIRRDFPDSVLWFGHLQTGLDGRTSVDVTFPDSLTTWRMIAVAVDDQTRVGETSRDLITRMDVIARLHTPRFLVERDSCTLTVIARNDLSDDKTVRASLRASGPVSLGDARLGGQPIDYVDPNAVDVRIDAGAEVAVDFELRAHRPGRATLTATVATDELADAVEKEIPVVAFGAQRLIARSGVLRSDKDLTSETVRFTLPVEMNPETPILEVHLNPTIAGVMLDAIPYLLDYPYGCTEQTMSRFLPAVVTRRTLERLGVRLSALAARQTNDPANPTAISRRRPVFDDGVLHDIVTTGLHRLAIMQRPDGGWGWWSSGQSDPYMTAYVVYGLAEAARSKVTVDAAMLERGVAFLLRSVSDAGHDAYASRRMDRDNVRVWTLYALSVADVAHLAGADARRAIDVAYRDRDELTDYTRAMLAMALHTTHDHARAATVIENLENTARVDDALATVSWGSATGYTRWYHNAIESTAMVLRALLAIRPDHPHVIPAANSLIRNRQGARWHSTKDTAFTIFALADYLTVSRELEPDMTVKVTYDDTISRSFRITPDNVLTFDARMIFAPEHLTPGDHTIRIEREGKGNLYHATYVDYYTKEDPIGPAGHDVKLTRTYARLIPKEVEHTRRVWDGSARKYIEEPFQALDYDRVALPEGTSVTSGDLVEVSLEIDAGNAFEYILLEDPKPAGCEPVDLHSGYTWGGGLCSNIEFRDDHIALFVSYLSEGKHTVSYRLRCETPGTFGALPAQLEAMYSPYLRANTASRRLTIRP